MPDEAKPNPALHNAARNLAAAESRATTTNAVLAAAQEEHADIAQRMHALEADRTEIVSRRQRGMHQQDDGVRLTLINADLEGLAALLVETATSVAAARAPAEAALRVLESARYVYQRTEDELAETALITHAKQCDAILLQTISELNGLQKRLNRGPPAWAPSRLLADELRRLQIQRGAG
jgi:hypothetical protein